MTWNLDNNMPIYLQLMDRIQRDIISGRYGPGDKLPSVRELAVEAAVNPNTMQKALSELERRGLVYSQRTSGRFITEENETNFRVLRFGKDLWKRPLGFGKSESVSGTRADHRAAWPEWKRKDHVD